MSSAWHGDWMGRIYHRIRQYGFTSVAEFAASQPLASLIELAESLGPDVAAVQIEKALHDEAQRAGQLTYFVKDMLVRTLRERLPAGWRRGADFESRASRAWAAWMSDLDESNEAATREVWRRMKAADIPDGWLPMGPDDPIIERAFAGVQFDAPETDT